jgi:lysophospholipase D
MVLVQLDVWILRDGQVVVFHDLELTRMTGGGCTARITDLKFSELPELAPNDPEWDQTSRCSQYAHDECKKIPLLEDVFKAVPKETCFIIEFKQDSAQLISEVHRLIKAADRFDTVLWFSLKEKVNKSLRTFDSGLPTLTSVDNMLKIIMAYYCGVMPFMTIQDKVFGITLDPVGTL